MTSIHLDLKEQIDRAVLEAKTELRTELAAMINRKVVSLETRMEVKINEVRKGTTSLLEELKTIVAAVHESQEKMGQALERMSNEVHVARRLLDSCDFTLAVVFWEGLANTLRLTEIVHNSTTDSHTYTGSQKR